ncbi:MAG: VanZ family protein [Nitrosospira multiformis]|nr:VanZ family protein [Nitrosospira multiformis]
MKNRRPFSSTEHHSGTRILAIILLLIAYGSLYPGNFSAPPAGSVQRFLTDFHWFTSLGDVLGNIALFFPLGMAGVIFRRSRASDRNGFIILFFLSFAYAFALQFAQIWLPSRSAALTDVMWNEVGTISGMGAAHLVETHFRKNKGKAMSFHYSSLLPLSILALWLLSQLMPLVPSLDWQKFKDALKPLFLDFSFSFPELLLQAAGMFAVASAILALNRPLALWLTGMLALTLLGKIVTVNLTLNASTVTGLLAGYAGCLVALRLGRARIIIETAFLALLIAWTIVGITPFSPGSGGSFNGIPFATMLQGSMEAAARGLSQSLFIYTSLLWLAQKLGIGHYKAVAGVVIWSFLIELMQMGLLGRVADITEPVLVLLVGFALHAIQNAETASSEPLAPAIPRKPGTEMSGEISAEAGYRRLLARTAAGIVIWVAIAWVITKSSLTPYNVRELVYEGHPFRSLLLLGLLLYWTLGFPVLILQWLMRGGRYLLAFVPLVLLHSLVAWLLVWAAVPTESIHDVVGSPVLGWPWEWELLGRFVALFSIWSVAATMGSLIGAGHFLENPGTALSGWALGACAIMPVAYHVVVREASTDNLVELMADNGSAGAFFLISLAMIILTFAGTKAGLAFVVRGKDIIRTAIWVLVAGVLSYLALYSGLEQVIIKYGQVFSAMQFLLSSDRAQLAGPGELLLRYAVVYFGMVIAIVTVQNPIWHWFTRLLPRPTRTRDIIPAENRSA